MYNQPYFIPNYYSMMAPPMMRGGAAMTGSMMRGVGRAAGGAGRGLGLFSKLGSSLGTLRSFNWGGLINNASKTLGVINQTIPLVKQVGPMFNNVRSMVRVASIFKDETDQKITKKSNNNSLNQKNNHSMNSNLNYKTTNNDIKRTNDNYSTEAKSTSFDNDSTPTFFIS